MLGGPVSQARRLGLGGMGPSSGERTMWCGGRPRGLESPLLCTLLPLVQGHLFKEPVQSNYEGKALGP